MSKEEEEILIGIIALWILLSMVNSSGASTSLGLAKIQSATDLGYVNAGTTLASNIVDDFTSN